MAITVYEYGLLQPTLRHDEVVDQIRLAHRYQNTLVEVERRRRDRYAAIMTEMGTAALEARIAELDASREAAADAVKAAKAGKGSPELAARKAEAKRLADELKPLRAELRELKRAIREDPAVQARIVAVNEAAAQEHRDARAVCGVYWGTYLLIEQAAQAANKSIVPPRFQRFDGEGTVAVQLPYGVPPENILGTEDRRVQVHPVPPEAWDPATPRGERKRLSRTTLRLRIGSEGRDPVWAEWPMVMHRPLPADGLVKWVKVLRRRFNQWWRWVVQFTVERPDPEKRTEGGPVAIDIGWRDMGADGLRVAVWSDHAGRGGQLLVPPQVTEALSKAAAIRGVRDENMDVLRAWLVERRKADDVPEWFRVRTTHLHQWRAPGKFAVLTRRATDGERAALPVDIWDRIEAWRHRDLHLWQYETGLREGAMKHRREVYRLFAAGLAQRYDTVVIEDFDLRKVAARPKVENTPGRDPVAEQADNKARAQRVVAAVSTLRQIITTTSAREGVTVVKVPAQGTTQDCHVCRRAPVTPWDAAAELRHTCEHCGATWDQDINAAVNILARAEALREDAEALASAVVGGSPREARFAKRHRKNGPEGSESGRSQATVEGV